MISLKKFLNSEPELRVSVSGSAQSPVPSHPQNGPLLSAYQNALAAMGVSGQRAIPALGPLVEAGMARVVWHLSRSVSPESVEASARMVEHELGLWADQAQQNQQQSEQAIRDLLAVVRDVSESNGTRDEKFSREIGVLSERLRAAAGLDSLPVIRRSIAENAGALTNCVTRLVEEGHESVRRLTSELAEYQTRLVASERRALLDPLTGLLNRTGLEQQLNLCVQSGQSFSLLVADLNGFKAANDRYGHLAGDEILKQFATELKAQFPPRDAVARWGGDEFVGIVTGAASEGELRVERVRRWPLGEYKIETDRGPLSITVDAAIGITTWNGSESGRELFDRADKEMYRVKQTVRQTAHV